MATLDWHLRTRDGIALVRLLVTSGATERVRVSNCLDGPVWPPRREGVPEEGWDEGGFEGVVGADERLVLGYACPADPCDPPARVTSLGSEEDGTAVTARDVVRSLGDPSPPRDTVASARVDTFGVSRSEGGRASPAGTGTASEESDCGPGERDTDAGTVDSQGDGDAATGGEWATVEAWLDGVADRAGDAERLAGVSSVPEASAALTTVGGAEDVAALVERLETDRRRVGRVAGRCETLAARLDDLDVPVETLARLA
jgi:hypothetical protein